MASIFLCGILYYQIQYVTVPDFSNKEVAEVRTWGSQAGVTIKLDQQYDFKTEYNKIVKQEKKGKKIKKGKELVVVASLGPNPEEVISLPDFAGMKMQQMKDWIKEHKAENISIIEEYNETIPAGSFLNVEMITKGIKKESYQRKNKAKVYFSKGKEVFEKNITVPNFEKKTKEEVETWTKKNDITLKVEEKDSETVETGKIIAQSVSPETKIAKKEEIKVQVSIGKALIVPDISLYSFDEASTASNDITIKTRQIYSDTVPYGQFINQTVPAGTKYTEKDRPTVQVFYSIGRPFIKDLRNNTLEGELQKIFYEEYVSKEAHIKYQTYYIDSQMPKGTVVEMSQYNEYLPLNYTVQIGISKGNLNKAKTAGLPPTDEKD